MANLTQAEAVSRRSLRRDFFSHGGVISTSDNGRVTVVIIPEFPGSRVALMATSIASPREKHLIPARGELNALTRLNDGQFAFVPNAAERYARQMDADTYAAVISANCAK